MKKAIGLAENFLRHLERVTRGCAIRKQGGDSQIVADSVGFSAFKKLSAVFPELKQLLAKTQNR